MKFFIFILVGCWGMLSSPSYLSANPIPVFSSIYQLGSVSNYHFYPQGDKSKNNRDDQNWENDLNNDDEYFPTILFPSVG